MSVRVPEKEGEVASRGAGARRRGEGDGFARVDPASSPAEDVPDPSEDVVSAPAARPLVAAYAAADRAGNARHDADEIVTAACGTCDDENGGGGEATLLDAKLVQSVLRRAAAQTGDGATVRSALTKALADDDDGFEVFDDPNDESDT